MPEYKDYELVGGRPVKISPFDAAAAGEGVHFAKEGCAFNPVIVSGGGGNPNYVETIEGTLANPFGELDFDELYRELGAGGVTLILSALGATMMGQINGSGSILFGTVLFAAPTDAAPWIGGSVSYVTGDELLDYAKVLQSGVWADLPAATTTTLTVIHHPLPEEP